MKKREKRNLQGTVLFTTVFVMALLILFLVGTLTLASASNNRAHKSYSTSQASYTARATIENFTKAMVREPGVAAAVYRLSETPGSVIYPSVVIDDPTIGSIGCYDTAGNWNEGVISVESVDGEDFVYMDNEGHVYGDVNMDTSKASWVKLARVKISTTVRVGREEETVVAYLNKLDDKTKNFTSSAPQVKGIQLVGNQRFPTGQNVTGGLGVALGDVTGEQVNAIRNPMDIDTTLTFVNSDLVWKTTGAVINVLKPDLHDANGNPIAPTLPYSQTVVNGNLCVSNNEFVNINYEMPSNYNSGDWTNKQVPYVYVDGALVGESSFHINDKGKNGAPFNLFAGTLDLEGVAFEMQSTNLYLMDKYVDDTKTYSVYKDYNFDSSSGSGTPKTVIKGDNKLGMSVDGKLGKWAYSVANGTNTSSFDVGGNIYCKGNLTIGQVSVAGDVRVEGDLNISQTGNFQVNGRLIVGGTINGATDQNGVSKIKCDHIYSTGGLGKSDYTQGGIKVDDYISQNSGETPVDTDSNGNVTRENFFVPAGKVDPFALEEVAPNAYGAIEYFKWIPQDHLNADGQPVDAFGNADLEDTTSTLYYYWNDNFQQGMFSDETINKFVNNEEFSHMSYEDAVNDLEFADMKGYLVDSPYVYGAIDSERSVPFNPYDGSSDHYFGTPRVREDRTIYTCGSPAAEGETYYYNSDEGQIWTQSYIDTLDEVEEHYIRAKIDGTRSTEWSQYKYVHYIGGDPNNFEEDNEPETKTTAPPVTAPPASTTTTVAGTTAAPIQVIGNLPADVQEIYPSDMQREKIYGYYDGKGDFCVEPATKIITNVSEARHALGLNSDGTINPASYPTSFPNAPTTQAYVDWQRNPEVFEGDVITKECVISGTLNETIHIKPNGGKMYIVLDNLTINGENEIIVDTNGPESGNVYFIVKGKLFMAKGAIRPSSYHEGMPPFDYTKDWGIIYYGMQDSTIEMQNDCLVVGSFKMPATKFIQNVEGKKIKVTYTDEMGRQFTAGENIMYPSLVGNAIFADMSAQNNFVNFYTAAGANSGSDIGVGTPIQTSAGTYTLIYLLGS